ncbi:beta-propeller fold lactonase family protein [Pendulispora brunnea]|uniref:Beta-propeller fold lactonase family protein n=1 Tax=Pendulispora brunnea TaxID=2905690 RepID=A0ABZ2K0X0_9BACT
MKWVSIVFGCASILGANVLACALDEPTSSNAWSLSTGGRTLYVTNSGNLGGDARIARFTLGPSGRLAFETSIPFCEGGRGLVFTPDARFGYAACAGTETIDMYRVEPDGALVRMGDVPAPGIFGIAIAPDGRAVYAADFDKGNVHAFRVAKNGMLAALNSVNTHVRPPAKGVVVTPNGHFVYVSHGFADEPPNELVGFALAADGSILRRVAKVPNGQGGAQTVITPDGRFLYVVSQGSGGQTFGYRIGSDGSLTPVAGSPVSSGDFSEGAAIAPDGRRLYVAAVGRSPDAVGEITAWNIGDDGALLPIQRLTVQGDPVGIGFAPDGRHLYVSDFLHDEVTAFRVSAEGSLTAIQTVPSGGADPAFQSIAILPARMGITE